MQKQKNITSLYMNHTIFDIKNILKNKHFSGYSNLNKDGLNTYLSLTKINKRELNKLAKKLDINKPHKINKNNLIIDIIRHYKKNNKNKQIINNFSKNHTLIKDMDNFIKKAEKDIYKTDNDDILAELLDEYKPLLKNLDNILLFNTVKTKLRKNRIIKNGVFTQNEVSKEFPKTPHLFDTNPIFSFFNINKEIFLNEALSYISNFDNVVGVNYKYKFIYYENNSDTVDVNGHKHTVSNFIKPYILNIRYDESAKSLKFSNNNINYPDLNMLNNNNNIQSNGGSGDQRRYIGFQIIIQTKSDAPLSEKELYTLKAFKPSSIRKYHDLTTASTSNNKICIYETFLHVTGKKSLRHMRGKENHKTIMNMLKDEGNYIEKSVKNGELVRSLELLTKKHNKKILVVYYGSELSIKDNKLIISGEKPFIVDNGVLKTIYSDSEIFEFINKICFLFQKNIHVAPFKLNIEEYTTKKEKNMTFKLNPKYLKNNNNNVDEIYAFDIETFLDEYENAIPYCVCLYGKNSENNEIKKSFYGLQCINEFIEYIDSICTLVNNQKSRPKNKTKNIYIYGFNNSKFDNIFIYDHLYEKNPCTKYVFTKSSIKYIQYNNIKFYDLCLHYNYGGLKGTAKSFKLDIKKDVFPYSFVNKNNLFYTGNIPDMKFWNSSNDYNEYINLHGNKFNMKEYTEKYCMLDSELVYRIAKIHLNISTGEINNRKYNVQGSPTSANLSIKIFQQCFLTDVLKQSPDNIIKCERNAYKGGRTEVFKKKFKSNGISDYLHYYDINSAHPSSMTYNMPYEYRNTLYYNGDEFNYDEIDDEFLYLAKFKYIGNDINFIPNLLIRDEKTNNIIAVKNSDEYVYQWGCELKEAILNNTKIFIKEVIRYTKKPIFKEFAEYFYSERSKIKKDNPCKSLFYKNVMNSLYGKFGQKPFFSSCLCKNVEEVYNKCDSSMLRSFNIVNDKIMIEFYNPDTEYSIGKLCRFSSYISAKTRCNLSGFMRDVGHENVYYCDTDSVFTYKKPSNKFIDQTKLGYWKAECEPINEATFLAPKFYNYITIDQEICKKGKGINTALVNFEDYDDLLNNKIPSIDVSSNMFFRTLENVKIKEQDRKLRPVYTKRLWYGNNSEAFNTIEEWRLKNK